MVSEVIADLQLIPQSREPVAVVGNAATGQPSELEERKPVKRLLKFWVPAAAVILVMCVLGIFGLTELRTPQSRTMGDDRSFNLTAPPPSVPVPPAPGTGEAANTKPALNTAPFAITVEPDQTLQDISVQYLGGYDLLRLHQIQALNPKLTDPDHIEVGQKIWLPGPPPVSIGTERDTSSQREEASMSRNFELMTQLELDAGAINKAEPASRDRAAAMDVVPILSSHASKGGGEEMLRLIQRIFLSANGSCPTAGRSMRRGR